MIRGVRPVAATRLAALCVTVIGSLCVPVSPSFGDDVATAIRGRLAGADAAPSDPGPDGIGISLRRFYEARNFRPAWITGSSPEERVRTAMRVVGAARDHGLDPTSYLGGAISGVTVPETVVEQAELDILLSGALGRYAADLRNGRTIHAPAAMPPRPATKAIAPDALLSEAAAARDLAGYFAGLAPATPEYARLRGALAAYRALAARGGWPALPARPVLRRDMADPAVEILRVRLAATGDLAPAEAQGAQFDSAVETGVQRFQRRHDLTADGIVGPKTREALNVPVEHRIEQMELNLERRRWMPEDPGRSYVFVNMADFDLKVVEDKKTVMVMRVIVGTPYWRTPLFSATMTYMEFSPYWNIPQSIVRQEIAPRVQRDPDYLARQGIRVFASRQVPGQELAASRVDWQAVERGTQRFRLRQEPGPLNPLGRVKFMFPNPFSVYLHDTPARELFEREVRTFSHGCIRVEQPLELAAYLLREKAPEAMEPLLHGGRPRVVPLPEPMPVHLAYLTAWVNKDGSLHFRRDVYGRDRALAQALGSVLSN